MLQPKLEALAAGRATKWSGLLILFGFQKFRGAGEPVGICKDRRGSVSVLAALTLPILVGLAALVVDCGFALSQRAALQQAADSAALAGAMAYTSTTNTTATNATISDVVKANGWPRTAVINPSGYLASANAVQVTLTATSPLWFGSAITSGSTLGFTVYSLATLGGSPTCIIALFSLTINSNLDTGTCVVAADLAWSLYINGSLAAGTLYTPVINEISGNKNKITATILAGTIGNPYTAEQATLDAGLNNCPAHPQSWDGISTTLSPGCWNGPIFTKAVKLSPGVYYMKNGFQVQSGGSIIGTGGVTVASDVALTLDGNITLDALNPLTSGGIALYLQHGGYDFNSNVTYKINGAIYIPTPMANGGGVTFDQGTWNANACTQIVAGDITFNSNAAFFPSCTGGGVGLSQ